jgi:hypothetical protein
VGGIVTTPVPSTRHADTVEDLAGRLRRVCAADKRVRADSGVVVPGTPVVNALGPDPYVARRDAVANPYVSAADVLLVVEVSLSTFRRDTTAKAAAYAEGGPLRLSLDPGTLGGGLMGLGRDGQPSATDPHAEHQLGDAYEEAWDEWFASGDNAAWNGTVTDRHWAQ